jgi:hypothetical protein
MVAQHLEGRGRRIKSLRLTWADFKANVEYIVRPCLKTKKQASCLKRIIYTCVVIYNNSSKAHKPKVKLATVITEL